MPTPSSDLSRPVVTRPDVPGGVAGVVGDSDDQSDTLRFRAPTLEEAIALAESSLGARVRVVAANRIRRGGIGGFFASDLGVEVTVALDDETVEEALERLVAGSTDGDRIATVQDDRARFADRLAAQGVRPKAAPFAPRQVAAQPAVADAAPVTAVPSAAVGARFDQSDDDAVPAVNPVLAEVLAALVAEAAQRQSLAALGDDDGSTTAPTGRTADSNEADDAETASLETPVLIVGPDVAADLEPAPIAVQPPTMLRVEQIMAELSAITAEPVFGDRRRPRVARPGAPAARSAGEASSAADATPAAERPRVLPTLPPRPSEVARRAADSARAAQSEYLAAVTARPTLATPSSPAPAAVSAPVATVSVVSPAPVCVEVEPQAEADHELQTEAVAVTAPCLAQLPVDDAGSTAGSTTELLDEGASVHAEVEIGAEEWADSEWTGPLGDTLADRLDAGSGAPSQRQVELAVAATDQLIESLTREPGVKRLTVRVVLRTGDHREVAAEAEWEAS